VAERHESLTSGFDVDENAVRFSNYFHVLRELVHLSCGHLPLEPRFEAKSLIGDHLYDDARAVTKIRRRLYELRTPNDDPGAPGDELAALLDRADAAQSTSEYLEIAYGELKPTLIAAVRTHLARLDPLIDEPSLRLLTRLLHRQERHTAELPAAAARTASDDLGALPLRFGETRPLKVMPPLDRPTRDDFIEVADESEPFDAAPDRLPADPEEQQRFFHAAMNAELCAAELTARNSHEHHDMPWDFHVDMARQTWDRIRHAEVHDRLMADELGCHWGDYPVGSGSFSSIYALDLVSRLALLNGTGEQAATWRDSHRRTALIELGQENVARVFDYVLADEVSHVDSGVRWGTHLLGGDENAYRERMRAV
jgi:hypothetical protein